MGLSSFRRNGIVPSPGDPRPARQPSMRSPARRVLPDGRSERAFPTYWTETRLAERLAVHGITHLEGLAGVPIESLRAWGFSDDDIREFIAVCNFNNVPTNWSL